MMEKDALRIASVKLLTQGHILRAQLDDDTHEAMKKLSEKTGISLTQLARILIEYALQHVEIVEL